MDESVMEVPSRFARSKLTPFALVISVSTAHRRHGVNSASSRQMGAPRLFCAGEPHIRALERGACEDEVLWLLVEGAGARISAAERGTGDGPESVR